MVRVIFKSDNSIISLIFTLFILTIIIIKVIVNKEANYDLTRQDSSSQSESQSVHIVQDTTTRKVRHHRVEIVRPLEDQRVSEGDCIQLECFLNRDIRDTDLVEWKRNGEVLVNSIGHSLNKYNQNLVNDFDLVCDGNRCALIIRNAQKRRDSGQYEVNLIELDDLDDGRREAPHKVKSTCNVFITSYVEKSEILKPIPRVLKLNEGECIKLECEFDKKPETVNW